MLSLTADTSEVRGARDNGAHARPSVSVADGSWTCIERARALTALVRHPQQLRMTAASSRVSVVKLSPGSAGRYAQQRSEGEAATEPPLTCVVTGPGVYIA